MGIGNILILSQATAFLLAFIFCLFTFIPMIVNSAEFNGHCLLYAKGSWTSGNDSKHPQLLHITEWGDSGFCTFPILVGVMAFPVSLFYILWTSVYLFKGTEPSWLAAFLCLTASCIVMLLTFVSCIMVTDGFIKWCDLIGERFSCETADYVSFVEETDVLSKHFYVEMGMAQFGLWASLLVWILLVGFASFQMYQYHKDEHFFISMQRERQRLLQRSGRYSGDPII